MQGAALCAALIARRAANKMRVDALLGTHFQCKPKGPRVCAALAAGRVTLRDVDGVEHVISDATFQLVVGAETLTCDGTALPRPFQRILAVHKEANAAADDAIDSGLAHPGLGQVGRLDKDTSGLILCGTDGGIQCLLAHPCSHVRKTYCVQLGPSRYARVHATEGPPSDTGPLDADAEAKFAAGLILDDRRGTKCAGATLERLGDLRVRITLAEGMHHHFKRMVGACGGTVVGLARTGVGPVRLGDLAPGTARHVSDAELVAIARAVPLALRGGSVRAAYKSDAGRPCERSIRARKPKNRAAVAASVVCGHVV